jgi:hypothetical protein
LPFLQLYFLPGPHPFFLFFLFFCFWNFSHPPTTPHCPLWPTCLYI